MKFRVVFLVILFFSSCNFFNYKQKENIHKKSIAKVFEATLYLKDVAELFPKNISKSDSLVLLKSFINSWATKQILLKKSEENSTLEENNTINKLVRKYKESLLINSYKEKLINQQIDTAVTVKEIASYYENNKQNFKLNEELLQIRYVYFSNDVLDKKEFVKLFTSTKPEDTEKLEQTQLSFKKYHLNDSIWEPLDKILLKLPFSKEKLLKKSKFIQKVDAKGVYLVAVKNILKRNDIAPVSYVQSTIKQMILHKRKLELIREIEKIILKDAVQNKSFIIY